MIARFHELLFVHIASVSLCRNKPTALVTFMEYSLGMLFCVMRTFLHIREDLIKDTHNVSLKSQVLDQELPIHPQLDVWPDKQATLSLHELDGSLLSQNSFFIETIGVRAGQVCSHMRILRGHQTS